MFYGYYEHTLDEKGRLVIPRKMREEAGNRLYIMKGYDGALSIFKESAFQKLVEEAEKTPFTKSNSRKYLRIQLGSTCEMEVDKQGRIQIPSQLLNRYNITKDVIILGVGNHIEVWSKETYLAYEQSAEDDFEEIAENLEIE